MRRRNHGQRKARRRKLLRKRTRRMMAWGSRSTSLPEGGVVVGGLGGIKMSEILVEFAQPLLSGEPSLEEYRGALALAALAWNTAVAPDDFRDGALADLRAMYLKSAAPAEDFAAIQDAFNMLIERKRTKYSHIHRAIDDLQVSDRPDEYNVVVLSTPLPGDPILAGHYQPDRRP